jgi:hypothetical protein
VAVGVAAMAMYLVWVCLQMAPHAHGGGATLVAIFAAVAAGAMAAFAGLRGG